MLNALMPEASLMDKLERLNNEAHAEIGDPIIDAIEAYQAGVAAYNAAEGEDEETVMSTYGAPFDVLVDWEMPAQTRAGAMAALRLAAEQEKEFGTSLLTFPLVRAALAYFESRAAN
ncbi:hypothetical protein [Sinorhizobium meliloti]|uniref:hypothetical protein n=1 Tax=Rhizobium meliloti TaxID=382 RepID=UPI000FDA093D|nr:hypothetical protein [Sinorhizobium meliloti]RVG50539.1 hypothetical protein CN226_21500 [Sinorhizobium meliloti]